MTTISTYRHVGGAHPETAALANTLAALGVRAPHTDRPYSEAMLLGIGGGLGAGYILWEFNEHRFKVLVLGFRARWQYPQAYLQGVCDRLHAETTVCETGSRATAANQLRTAIERGVPAIAWVDRAHLPYLQMPEAMKGHIGHLLAVCGLDDSTVVVDDLAASPLHVPLDTFADARARIGSYKNRLLLVEPPTEALDLPAAIMDGLRSCVEHLSQPSESFSLPALRKWARMMTDGKNAKGWPVLFRDGSGLFGTLTSLYEGVRLENNDPGALRGLYAAFLDEATDAVALPALADVAARYRALSGMWSALAEAALPDDVAPLHEAKTLLRQRHELLTAHGDRAPAGMRPLTERLAALRSEHNRRFPLDATATADLFAALHERLMAIYRAETEAIAALGRAVS